MRAACAFNRAVAWVIGVFLALVCAISGYALWDSANLFNTDLVDENGQPLTFAEALAANPDVCAWLAIDNTNIDYPVVRGKDNFEYLDKDALGEESASGAIFLDSECSREFDEPYEVLMGHHMQYGKMFGDLDKFLDQGFFEQNETGRILLPNETLELQICAVVKADAYDGLVFSTPIVDASRMPGIVSHLDELALLKRDGALSADDQVVVLSTCSSTGENDRTVLVCRVSDRYAANNA